VVPARDTKYWAGEDTTIEAGIVKVTLRVVPPRAVTAVAGVIAVGPALVTAG